MTQKPDTCFSNIMGADSQGSAHKQQITIGVTLCGSTVTSVRAYRPLRAADLATAGASLLLPEVRVPVAADGEPLVGRVHHLHPAGLSLHALQCGVSPVDTTQHKCSLAP